MEALLGFEISVWDYVTFAAIFIIVLAGLAAAIFILGLPGRIAIFGFYRPRLPLFGTAGR